MLPPVIPDNENERLNILRQLSVLDSNCEERYDRITRLAKRLFDVPIALVSLVDHDRQWFKSAQGLEAKQTPRDISFCGHAILKSEILVVNDASNDERFADNPLVTEDPSIRFYAGYPLEIAHGSQIGTLCLIDSKPRVFTTEDKITLQDLGVMIEAELKSLNMATTDQLTSLTNRRGFLDISTHVFALAMRKHYSLVIFFIDLDGFKAINDTYGHQEGDRVLIETSKILLNVFREMDIICRIGGDEFCVLCSDLTADSRQLIKERLAHKFNEFNRESEKEYDLKYSLGCIKFDANHHESFERLLDDADKSMYQHKKVNKL